MPRYDKTYSFSTQGFIESRQDSRHNFRCEVCGFRCESVYDKKKGIEVKRVD